MLSETHHAKLQSSGIIDVVASRRGYETVEDRTALSALGFSPAQCCVPALTIPLYDVRGERCSTIIRPDDPRVKNGRVIKYDRPKGVAQFLDVHPILTRQGVLRDATVPLIITEGTLKADAAISVGHKAIGLIGVYGYRGRNANGARLNLPDFDFVAWDGREVCIVFDSDARSNPSVLLAAVRLAHDLDFLGAKVSVAFPDPAADGSKVGLDDYIVGGGKIADLLSSAMTPSEAKAMADQRPRVQADGPPLDVKEQALTALAERNEPPTLFCRGGQFARILADGHERRIELLTAPMMRDRLERVLAWIWPTKDGFREGAPPGHIVEDLLSLPDIGTTFPLLDGIVTSPFFTAEGVFVSTSGYNRDARVLAALGDLEVPPLPTPEAAIALITGELLVDFPFESQGDLANAIGLMLLPLVHPMISGTTPLHHIASPTPGTGKSLLTDMLLMGVSGHGVTKTPPVSDDNELRKRITAILLAGSQVIVLDNADGNLNSPSLAAALTSEYWCDRVLGHSRTPNLRNRAIWVMTGNNVVLSTELARRSVLISLDANDEKPWKRDGWRHPDLRQWAAQHRGEIIASLAALVVSWLDAGRPHGSAPFGDFADWARTIGGILDHAGIEGFMANANSFDALDAEGEELAQLVTAWWSVHKDKPVTAKDLAWTPGVADAIDLTSRKGSPAAALGYYLRSKKGRVVLGRKIVGEKDSVTHTVMWHLAPTTPKFLSPVMDSPSTSTNAMTTGDTGDDSSGFQNEFGTIFTYDVGAATNLAAGGNITGITGTNTLVGGVTCTNTAIQPTGDDLTGVGAEEPLCAQCSAPFTPRTDDVLGEIFCAACALS